MSDQPSVALVTDVLTVPGGASRVLKDLLDIFPKADIFTSLFEPSRFPWLDPSRVRTTFIQKLPLRNFWRNHYVLPSPIAFEQFSFSDYDVVISLSAGCAKGVITRDDVPHIAIILTPPRNQWDSDAPVGRGLPFIRPLVNSYLRMWDIEASLRPDKMVAISRYVQKRIKKVYRRDAHLVYPGIDTTYWTADHSQKRGNFYLVVSRLYQYKRIDIAIEACRLAQRRLIIIGEGPQRGELSSLAEHTGADVEFKGRLPDSAVRDFYRSCRGFLFPGVEDFGLTPVEAMACGAPVIAFNDGGVPETVADGQTGVLFAEQSARSMADAILRAESITWRTEKIRKRAKEFSGQSFKSGIRGVVETVFTRVKDRPDFDFMK